jgi:intein/homing endonuclease
MTPKEKAIELYDKYAGEFNFDDTYRDYKEQSKQCALILCNELIANSRDIAMVYDLSFDESENYWTKVKQEIELL